ncbi:sarcinarray family MAST domain-containing protein [Methanosarcina sp. MSH10X1]|uniref:sarcinarray family MAST domain-containing protein n=1 Tax=Methanosarcina sp. MSH10X1 TaxID=2507075 RepID=UPI000FFC63C3|nr:sarcinarray family MAST domain-containing protein [Methanosarcina sp. MSH10X1]RXA21686.1 sarcinarray family MAST domain-containing protein [Methanosarcina sp. MSH10X1]
MKIKCLIIILILISAINIATASNPYGKIYTYDVYYNDKLLPGEEIAKPFLNIGEPFKVKLEMKLNQTSTLFVQVCSLGGNFFEVIDGPSEFEKMKYMKSLDPGTHVFEWTIIPTDEWAGGSIPINIFYQINLPDEDEPAVNGEFTVAYCTISNEYYKGEATASETQSTPEQPSSENSTSPASAPAFSLVTAILALAFVFLKLSHSRER